MTNSPSTEERVWAALAHLSAMAFGMGLLLPIIGWSEKRRKSNYVSFQCLQALGYQSLGYTVWLLGYLVLVVVFFCLIVAVSMVPAGADAVNGAWIGGGTGILLGVLVLGTFGLYFLFPLIAAISCGFGKDFRYPVMGNRLARYLGYDPAAANDEPAWLIEEHEDRWVAAMGHVSVIIYLWGILAPLTAWIMQGKRSLFLKFQSAQTVAYQVFVNGVYVASGVIPFFGVLMLFVLTGLESGPGQPTTPSQMIGLTVFGVSMLVFMLFILAIPLFHIYGQWAGYRVLKGHDFRYPLVGKWVERWAAGKAPGSETAAELEMKP